MYGGEQWAIGVCLQVVFCVRIVRIEAKGTPLPLADEKRPHSTHLAWPQSSDPSGHSSITSLGKHHSWTPGL